MRLLNFNRCGKEFVCAGLLHTSGGLGTDAAAQDDYGNSVGTRSSSAIKIFSASILPQVCQHRLETFDFLLERLVSLFGFIQVAIPRQIGRASCRERG